MNLACFDAGIAVANHPFSDIWPALASKNPVIPAATEPNAMQSSNIASGRQRSRADNVGPKPNRAETASPTPRQHPTHHVASIPHCKARRLGDVSGSILGCATEKYSTQILAVTWSWRIPYVIAAARLSNQIFTASITAPKTHATGYTKRMIQKASPATAPEAGMVSIHAHTMRRATPQRTAERRCIAPTPTIAPVMVWVVLTGMPASAVPNRVSAPALSAQNPPIGFSLVIFDPMVWTMRQPPK